MQETIQRTELDVIEQTDTTTQTPDVTVETEPSVEGAQELQAILGDIAGDTSVSGFKCAHPECGLVHEHSTNKHRATDSFDMSADGTSHMESNSVCHCGLNELARTGVDDAPSPSKANDMAPIPDSMARHLDSQ